MENNELNDPENNEEEFVLEEIDIALVHAMQDGMLGKKMLVNVPLITIFHLWMIVIASDILVMRHFIQIQ